MYVLRTHVMLVPEMRIGCLSAELGRFLGRFHGPSSKAFLIFTDIFATNDSVDLLIGFRTPSTATKKPWISIGQLGVNVLGPGVESLDFPTGRKKRLPATPQEKRRVIIGSAEIAIAEIWRCRINDGFVAQNLRTEARRTGYSVIADYDRARIGSKFALYLIDLMAALLKVP